MTARSARYLRSSKDRHDVALDAQRTTLQAIEAKNGDTNVEEFADAVERADDWHRPGFVQLLEAIKNPARAWTSLYVLDGARIARDDDYLAAWFRKECRQHGVKIVYAKLPSVNPMYDMMMQHLDQLMSRIHSMTSREKGLGGMQANVSNGYRAGGRAPIGYRLRRIPTGAIREGAAVTKSKLEPDDQAPAIARYLKGRAAGEPRAALARELGLRLSKSTLIGLEWNALTYAGNTVWNCSSQKQTSAPGYQGGTKRRPRADWIIQAETHPALIDQAEAEQILTSLQERKTVRMKGAAYLLSGILVAPDGRRWHGDGDGSYRCGPRRVSAAAIERALLEKIAGDLTSEAFVRSCLQRARDSVRPREREAELRTLQRQIAEAERKAGRIRNIVQELQNPGGMIRELDKAEAQKLDLERRAAAVAESLAGDKVLLLISEDHVKGLLRDVAAGLDVDLLGRDHVKQTLRELLERIELEPTRLVCQLDYAIPVITGDKVASPRGRDLIPGNASAVLRARRALALVPDGRQRLPRPSPSQDAVDALQRRVAGQTRGPRGRFRRAA